MYDIETLLVDRVLHKEIFMAKSGRNCASKTSHRPHFSFGK